MKHAEAVLIITAACLAGCWQAAGIDLRDLPVRDGSEEVEESEADTAEGDDDLFDVPDVDLSDPVPDLELDDIFTDDPAVDEVPPGMSAEAFCTGLLEAFCQHLTSCCGDLEMAQLQARYNCDDPGASAFFIECVDQMSLPIERGMIVIDEAGFYESCRPMLTLSSGDCPGIGFFTQMFDELFETYCADVIVGLVTEGDYCTSRMECEGGLCCSSGTCTGCKEAGMECTANDQCAAGRRCIDHACVPPSGPEERCDLEDESTVSDCMAGTWCNVEGCRQLQVAGQPCPPSYGVDPCRGMCGPEGLCLEFCSVSPS